MQGQLEHDEGHLRCFKRWQHTCCFLILCPL